MADQKISLQTTVGGIALGCCIYNASGPRTAIAEQLRAIGRTEAGAVLSKSATPEPRAGNGSPRYKEVMLGDGSTGSINSEGLPNKGIDYYISEATVDMITKGMSTPKPYFISLSGLSLEDNLKMYQKLENASDKIKAVELNLACPNVPGKPIMAYDFDELDRVLTAFTKSPAFQIRPLGVKLPPYFDMPHFEKVASILNKYPIKFVVCTNTIGNGLIVDPVKEEALIAPKGGFGGLAGIFVKQTALANVRKFSSLLNDSIDVVGAGGVNSGIDAFELILCGAKAVQVGTAHRKEGPVCFNRISSELRQIMAQKGYSSIEEFRGKLNAPGKGRKDQSPIKLSTKKKNDSVISLIPFPYIVIAVLLLIIAILILK